MRIYNTLSRRKEEFKPLEEGKVKMYVCGPTVYNLIHIGNARPMIVFDTVRRYLEYKGYDVNYVSNFTDVDDKIIKKANEEGVSAEEISTRYIAECKKDMEGMNIKPATTHPLATQEIGGMIDMIQTLIDKGYAYEVNGTVYYRTRKFAEYGKLSKKNIDDLEAGHRDEAHSLKVTGEDEKEDPLDFVLWKPKKEGEPSWPSPWSDGRPGWHIECSVMSKKYLADEIDIHAGGEDLIFPHHENEIAQSEAANGVPFSKYWMHNAFLNIDNKKMSKSLGNFFTVRDISREYDLEVLRFFMLSAHYRNPVNFSHDLMESAKNGLDRILTAVDNLKHLSENAKDVPMTEDEKKIIASIDDIYKKFEDSMDDDFNTADAISAIFELVKLANSNSSSDNSREYIDTLMKKITTLTDILGLKTDKKEEMLDEDIEPRLGERLGRVAEQRADRLRVAAQVGAGRLQVVVDPARPVVLARVGRLGVPQPLGPLEPRPVHEPSGALPGYRPAVHGDALDAAELARVGEAHPVAPAAVGIRYVAALLGAGDVVVVYVEAYPLALGGVEPQHELRRDARPSEWLTGDQVGGVEHAEPPVLVVDLDPHAYLSLPSLPLPPPTSGRRASSPRRRAAPVRGLPSSGAGLLRRVAARSGSRPFASA